MNQYPPILPEVNPQNYKPSKMQELTVGVRVRWRISGECGYKCSKCEADFHAPWNGCAICTGIFEGIILQIHPDSRPGPRFHTNEDDCGAASVNQETHIYFIETHELRNNPLYHRGFWAAAAELIVITDEEGDDSFYS